MNNTQSARLVLRTYTLSSNFPNATNATQTKYTFSNLNLRTILGDLYDKYDTFNLCLKSIGSEYIDSTTDLLGVALDELSVIIKIKGLPFINQTYTWSNLSADLKNFNTDTTTLTTVNFKKGDALQLYFVDDSLTFSKNQDVCNITFEYEPIKFILGYPTQEIVPYPEMCYIFDIYGVGEPKDVNKIVSQRLF